MMMMIFSNSIIYNNKRINPNFWILIQNFNVYVVLYISPTFAWKYFFLSVSWNRRLYFAPRIIRIGSIFHNNIRSLSTNDKGTIENVEISAPISNKTFAEVDKLSCGILFSKYAFAEGFYWFWTYVIGVIVAFFLTSH